MKPIAKSAGAALAGLAIGVAGALALAPSAPPPLATVTVTCQEAPPSASTTGNTTTLTCQSTPSPSPAPTAAAPSTSPQPSPASPSPSPSSTPAPRPSPSPVAPSPSPSPLSVCPADLQAAVTNTAAFGKLDVTACGPYAVSLSITKQIRLTGAVVNAPAGKPGIVVGAGADGTVLDHVRVVGAQSAKYVAAEKCMDLLGTSTNPLDKVTVTGSSTQRCGYGGVHAAYATNLVVQSSSFVDSVYAGILLASVSTASIDGNTITGVGKCGCTTESNAYGVTATQESGPASRDVTVSQNVISDIPTWHGIDTHGSVNFKVLSNRVYHVRRAIFLTTSPTNALVDGNDLTAPTAAEQAACPPTSPAAYCTDYRGISLFGGSATITDNTGHGYAASRWWNYGGGSFTASGNSPAIP